MRKHLALIVGFGLPVLLIIAVILSIYLPRLYMDKPHSGFLFFGGSGYPSYKYIYDGTIIGQPKTGPAYDYAIRDERLSVITLTENGERGFDKNKLPTVYFYDVKNNTYKVVPEEKLGNYRLINSEVSPDGFKIIRGGDGGTGIVGELFFGGGSYDYDATYLSKGSFSQKLNLPNKTRMYGSYCYDSSLIECGFVGWVVGEGGIPQ